jgi:hypothetical protein
LKNLTKQEINQNGTDRQNQHKPRTPTMIEISRKKLTAYKDYHFLIDPTLQSGVEILETSSKLAS